MYNSIFYDFKKNHQKKTNRWLGRLAVCLQSLTKHTKLFFTSFVMLFTVYVFNAQTGTIQIGTGTTNTGYNPITIPISNYSYVYSQQLVTASEYSIGLGAAGEITKIRWMFPNRGSNLAVYGDWDIWIGHTTKTAFNTTTDWIPISELTQVFSGNIHTLPLPPTNNQWFEIEFSTPFNYNGTDNIVVAVHEKTPNYAAGNLSIRTYISTPNSGIMYRNDSNNPDPANPPNASNAVTNLAQLQFEGALAPDCSGIPTAGNVIIDPIEANGGSTYNVTAENFALATGLTYTWESSTDNGANWTQEYTGNIYQPLLGKVAPVIIGSQVQYRLKVACGSDEIISDVETFTTVKVYCQPEFPSNNARYVKSFTTLGGSVNINNVTNAKSPGGYGDFTDQSLEMVAGYPFSFSATFEGNNGFAIWIDWNDNGTFEPSERVFNTTGFVTSTSGTITIPSNVQSGTYRMRILCSGNTSNPNNACYIIANASGEAEDYTFIVNPTVACTGTPMAGTVTINPPTANEGLSYSVTALGFTMGSGLTYTWETSTDSGANWVQSTGTSIYQELTGQIAPLGIGSQVYHRLRVACGSEEEVSDTVIFTTGVEYCSSSLYTNGCSNGAKIANFEITNAIINLTNNTGIASCGANAYNDFSSMVATVAQGSTISLEVGVGTYAGGVKIWVDWNGNGNLDIDEIIAQSTETITSGGTFTETFTIPANANLGDYRLRVRVVENTINFTACSVYSYGEIEDYTIRVIPPQTCLPPQVLTATQTSLTSTTLGWTSDGTLFDVEWGIEGFALGNGTQINGITTNSVSVTTVTDTPYQFYVRRDCGAGDVSLWNGPFGFETKYCTPSGLTSSTVYYISEVRTTGALVDINYNVTSPSGYVNESQTTFIYALQDTNFSLFIRQIQATGRYYVWIDTNNNGEFEANENVYSSTSNAASVNLNLSIPASMPLGNYRMRIANTGINTLVPTACGPANYGNYIDFTLSIISPPTCPPVANLNADNLTATSTIISWTAGDSETSWDIEWGLLNFVPGTGTQIGNVNVNSANHTITGLTADTDYKAYVRADCGGSDQSVWRPVKFRTGYCIPNGLIASSVYYVRSITTSGAIIDINYQASFGVGYVDATATNVVSAIPGSSFSFNINQNTNNPNHYYFMWIDWNGNLSFNDTGETILATTAMSSIGVSGTITIPSDFPLGNYRVRVASNQSINSTSACGPANYGNFVDFTLSVIAPPNCLPVSDITISNQTTTSVDASWTAGDSETSWIVEWGTQGFSPGTGAQLGTQTVSSTNVSITGLTAETNYQIYVRADCGVGNQSVWKSIDYRTGYCVPVGFLTSANYYIKSVISTYALTNINYQATSGVSYVDVSSTNVISAFQGSTFSLTLNQNNGSAYYYIWIDWNNNLNFDDAGETIMATTFYTADATGTITIPSGFPLGNYRLRVANSWSGIVSTACGPSTYGNFVDFTLMVVAPPTCLPPTAFTFTQNSLTSATLGWTSSGNLFDVEWGNAGFSLGSGTQINGLITNFTTVTTIENTDYHFYVRQNCGSGDISIWQGPFTFKTAYCTHIYTFGCSSGAKISNFEINDAVINLVNNTGASSCGANGYNDFTALSASASEIFEPSVVVQVDSYAAGVKIWIDWNQNGFFEIDEIVAQSTTTITAGNTFTGTFTVPAGTPIGDYRLRVRVVESSTNFTACSSQNYGETEDYTFKVVASPSCLPVFLPITATNSSATSVLLEWVSDGNLFDIEYGEAGFTQGSGTMLLEVSNNYILQGLTTGNNYQYYVRQNCGNGDESIWRGPISFTPGSFSGKISSMLDTEPEVTSIACGTTFAIDVPAGKQIASLNVQYTMTSASPRFISEQRSVLYSPTLNAGESEVISGDQNSNFAGVSIYSRNVTFANGATGTVEFELKAWRVAGNPDCTDDEIFVEPGTWILSPTFEDLPPCPNPPTDLGYNVISESSVELFWTEGEANATHQLKYGNVGFDVDTTGTSVDNLTSNTLILNGLDPFVAQEFYVRRDCGSGDFSDWAGPFRFNSGYCLPYSTIVYHFTAFSTTNAIENVSYSNATPNTSGYVNNTALIIEQTNGESFDFSSNYIGGASGLRIWIDWNNDLVFDDTEQVFYLGNNSGNKSGTITIPSDKLPGDYRMRIRVEQGASSIPPVCGAIGFGEAMDFILRIPCPTIAPPTGETEQTFTTGQTIADLVVNGSDLVWYSDNTYSLTLSQSEELVDGTTYYVVSEVGNCQSEALVITVTDCSTIVSTPTGETEQTFTAGQTIADLVVNGSDLVWYSDNTYSLTLSDNELLVDGTTYYVVSEFGNCQSDPLIITVTQVVSRSDFDLYGFKYHPNPVNDILYFSSNQPIEKVTLTNMLGQQIDTNLSSDNKNLDMSNLPTGNYFVKITIEGVSKTIKVAKQ